MQEMYQCSLIIPVHNLEQYIERCIESINEQTCDSFETIWICDDCTDKTVEIIKQKCRVKNLKLIHCKVDSCGLARNYGLDCARGKYIWFIDGDDWLTNPNAIQLLVDELDCGYDILKFQFESQGYTNKSCDEMVWQYGFSREIIGDKRFREQMPAEDGDFVHRIFKGCIRFKEISASLYHYNYPREHSIMWEWNRRYT